MAIRAASRTGTYGGAYLRRLDTAEIAPVFGRPNLDGNPGNNRKPGEQFDEEFARLFGAADGDDDDGTYSPVPPNVVRS